MHTDVFDTLILIARPAAGKSEIIHALKNMPADLRRDQMHIGKIAEIDDFPMLWAWFEEDDLLEQMGQPRLHSSPDGYFKWNYLWNLLIRRISLEHRKLSFSDAKDSDPTTVLVEFSRGKEHGGYREAFEHLSKPLLSTAAILYVNVSFEESLRKNRRRFNPDRPHSILEHGLSDEKMQRLYAETDWHELTGGAPRGSLTIQGVQVPYAVFENEDDVTTPGGAPLHQRLGAVLDELWTLYASLQGQQITEPRSNG